MCALPFTTGNKDLRNSTYSSRDLDCIKLLVNYYLRALMTDYKVLFYLFLTLSRDFF